MVLLALPPGGSSLDQRVTGAAAQTRMVSVARIRPVSRKSTRLFKGIICDDIFEFESYMPSHAVRSLPANVPARLERQAGMLDGAGRSICGVDGDCGLSLLVV